MKFPALTVIILLLASLSSCTLWRTVRYNAPGIKDYKIFPSRSILAPPVSSPLVDDIQPLPAPEHWAMGDFVRPNDDATDFLKRTGTVALLVLKGDTIKHEWFRKNYDYETTYTSFSLSKVYVSTLVGIAISEGKIKGIDQLITDYFPEFKQDSLLAQLKIRHLLQMTSGIRSGESPVNPFNRVSKMYYGRNMDKALRTIKPQHKPGTRFKYLNINTQLLARILTQATGKPLSKYLEEKIWIPAGMESDATWSLDMEGGEEKAFCCINARVRDFARFGMLYMNQGYCREDSLVPGQWICDATSFDTIAGARSRYQYAWYTTVEQEDFFGQGLIGQFIYVCPATQTVIVRLGKKLINYGTPWYDIFKIFGGVMEKPAKVERSKAELKQYAGDYLFYPSNLGDSSLVGKMAKIIPKNGYLKVDPDFRKGFRMEPGPGHTFFHEKEGRRMEFIFDEKGEVQKILWSKRGNEWEVWKN